MTQVVVAEHIDKRVLTARASVEALIPVVLDQIAEDGSPIEFDFALIGAVSPAAIDQILVCTEGQAGGREVRFLNMPYPASRVHEAIARAHGRTLVEDGPQSWVFKAPAKSHA
ncbi:MAG: hypothetical protein OXL97_04815 [Chloroflexota bacterium]|nr:hypothetical protein [Chloroflexota bacterium]MDE2884748.1 hypothetical protein [Chloroflexota bacterium]